MASTVEQGLLLMDLLWFSDWQPLPLGMAPAAWAKVDCLVCGHCAGFNFMAQLHTGCVEVGRARAWALSLQRGSLGSASITTCCGF